MYEILWSSKSHLFAAAVTSLAYSRYAADYNYTKSFVALYANGELTFYLPRNTITDRIEHARVFFSQEANRNLYFTECRNLGLCYRAFYYSLANDYSGSSNAELASLFSSLLQLQAKCASLYQGTNEYATKNLQDQLVSEVKKHTSNWQEAVAELSVSTPREIDVEEEDYAKLVQHANPDFLAHIKRHPWVCGKAFLFEEAVSELNELMKARKSREKTEKEKKFEHLLLDKKISDLATSLSQFSSLRITLKNLLQHKLLGSPIYKEIASRMEVEQAKLMYTFDAFEILQWLELNSDYKPVTGHKTRLYVGKGTVIEIKGPEEAEKFKSSLISEDIERKLFGSSVYPGKIKGIARVILPDRLNKINSAIFNEGDVLVTTMTNPNMIFLASKAAGIVTNEGGVTCHAAIISRELKKPCIVATRKATSIIKDGDLVEVDANSGTVRKIST